MKILHLVSSHRWTGAAEPASDLAKAQIALGAEAEIACVAGHSFWRRIGQRGVPRVGGFDFQSRFRPLAIARDVLLLRRLLREGGHDVVHCHLQHDHWIAAAALTLPLGGGRKRPLLVRTLHRDEPPRTDPVNRWLLKRATGLIVSVSRAGLRAVRERLGMPESRSAYVHGAVDPERFNPRLEGGPLRALWSIPPEAPVAGIVARMQHRRGHWLFAETIGGVTARVPEAHYIIAGRGEAKNEIKEKVRAHPLAARLHLAGYRKNDLPETYRAMNVAVLLAKGSDGACRAMLEAMACGRPVIGLNRGAMADVIEPGRTGWLIEPGDSAALTAALIEALGDLDRTEAMGRAAREVMERDYSQESRARLTLEAYERAAAALR